jgi:hypothetical protein
MNSSEINIIDDYREMFRQEHIPLLYDSMPECHRLTPHVTLASTHRKRGTP